MIRPLPSGTGKSVTLDSHPSGRALLSAYRCIQLSLSRKYDKPTEILDLLFTMAENIDSEFSNLTTECARLEKEIRDHAEWAKKVSDPESPEHLPLATIITNLQNALQRAREFIEEVHQETLSPGFTDRAGWWKKSKNILEYITGITMMKNTARGGG